MANVDFITDEELRASLTSDLVELDKAMSSGCFKAAHVLSGSVVEAVLIDYLVAFEHVERNPALKMELGDAIKKCLENGVMTQRTADLCSVVRSYRNLIHPGRVVRLEEKVSANTAQVARSLVDIVLKEIEDKRSESYGLTAEQILGKLERDFEAGAILSHLLKGAKTAEIKRLLLRVIPEAAERTSKDEYAPAELPQVLSIGFRTALKNADVATKKEVVQHFAEIVSTANSALISNYSNLFFRSEDLEHASKAHASLIKDYLLARLKRAQNVETLKILHGISARLLPADAHSFVDPLVQSVLRDISTKDLVIRFLSSESTLTNNEFELSATKRLRQWQTRMKEAGNEVHEALVGELVVAFDIFGF